MGSGRTRPARVISLVLWDRFCVDGAPEMARSVSGIRNLGLATMVTD